MADRCIWTGRPLESSHLGGAPQKFADNAARAEAHKAARKYTLALIEAGDLTWDQLRSWYRGRNSRPGTYTAPGEGDGESDG